MLLRRVFNHCVVNWLLFRTAILPVLALKCFIYFSEPVSKSFPESFVLTPCGTLLTWWRWWRRKWTRIFHSQDNWIWHRIPRNIWWGKRKIKVTFLGLILGGICTLTTKCALLCTGCADCRNISWNVWDKQRNFTFISRIASHSLDCYFLYKSLSSVVQSNDWMKPCLKRIKTKLTEAILSRDHPCETSIASDVYSRGLTHRKNYQGLVQPASGLGFLCLGFDCHQNAFKLIFYYRSRLRVRKFVCYIILPSNITSSPGHLRALHKGVRENVKSLCVWEEEYLNQMIMWSDTHEYAKPIKKAIDCQTQVRTIRSNVTHWGVRFALKVSIFYIHTV